MSIKMLSFTMYPVYDIPDQIRRRIGISGGLGDLQTLSRVVDQLGEEAPASNEFTSAMAGVVDFDPTPTGFERPFVDISGAGEMGVRLQYGPQDTGVYNWIAVLVSSPVNLTRSTEQRYIMSGYTSRGEPSLLGRMPDDLRLYINDLYCIQTTYLQNGLGERQVDPASFRVLESHILCQALDDQLLGTVELDISPVAVTKTAEMVRKISVAEGAKLTPDRTNKLGGEYFSSNFQPTPQLIASQLSNPEGFVGTLARGYMQTKLDGTDDIGTTGSFFKAGGTQVEQFLRQKNVQRNLNAHDLISAMKTALAEVDGLGSNTLGHRSNFTLANLRGAIMNPNELDVAVMQSVGEAKRHNMRMAMENTDSWVTTNGQSTRASLVSYDLAQQLGPVLSSCLIGTVRFVYDNRMVDLVTPPVLHVVEQSVGSITNGILPRIFAARLLEKLKMLMLKVSKHNRLPFQCTVIAQLGSVTRVEIAMDGGLPEFFTYASFMSNRMHVGLTTDPNYVGALGSGVKDIMIAIDEGYEEHTRRSNIVSQSNHLSLALGSQPTTLNQTGLGTPSPVLGADTHFTF